LDVLAVVAGEPVRNRVMLATANDAALRRGDAQIRTPTSLCSTRSMASRQETSTTGCPYGA